MTYQYKSYNVVFTEGAQWTVVNPDNGTPGPNFTRKDIEFLNKEAQKFAGRIFEINKLDRERIYPNCSYPNYPPDFSRDNQTINDNNDENYLE